MPEAKEHKSEPLKDVKGATESDDVINTMEGRMSNLKDILNEGPAEPEPEPEDSTPEPDPEPEPEPAEETEPEPEPTPEPELKDEDGSKDTEDPPEATEIPEGYVRAARRQGWSDEDIADEIKANPDRALRLFQNAYETTNKATRDFAAIGRAQAEATRKAAEEKANVETPEVKDYITVDEIAKIADGDEATAAALRTINQVAKEQAAELAKYRKAGPSTEDLSFARSDQAAATARANAAANEADQRRVNEFFGAENMKPYGDFYGVISKNQDMGDITPNQYNHRIEVMQVADQLIVGKAAQGMNLPVTEALEDAHLLVTESIREKIITDGIRSSLKKRSKSKTLRPSAGKKTSVSNEPTKAKDRDEAVANAGRRLAKLFKN